MNKYSFNHFAQSKFFLHKLNFYLFSFFLLFSANINSQNLSAEKIYKKVSDAVVVIHAYDSNNKLSKQGSGVVINNKGFIVTNYHVLEGCERLEILHNKKIIPYVDIIGIDVELDILIIKIGKNKFPSIKIGDSKNLNIGQRVYAIGSPMGFENTMSEGIISGLRIYEELGKNYIQITASISHGSSGGAIVNDKGELIGISTLTAKEGQNLNFAIPIDAVLSVALSSYLKNDNYKDFELFSKGGNAYDNGDYQEAIKHFTNYINKYPNSKSAYNNRGIAKNALGDNIDAILDFDKAIEISPNFAVAYCNRGKAKHDLKYYNGAIQDYTKAIEINPNFVYAYISRGDVKDDMSDPYSALLDYDKAIEINPNFSETYNYRANTKSNLGDFKGAIQDYNKAIDINPNFAGAYNNRGAVKKNLEDYRGAVQDYTKAIEINPNYAGAYSNRGIARLILHDYSGGCLDLSKAGELGDDNAYNLIRKYCN